MNKPNVIIIYADDLGYGDLSCYGAMDIATPNVDKLAAGGVKFNNAYSTSAVCTPARYSLLTGEYPFRNADTTILTGDAKCIIAEDKLTLAKVFKQANYATAVIGKWHLGLSDGTINWNEPISHTPNDVGFDYSFIFPGTNDRVPLIYLKNHDVLNFDPADPIEVCYENKCPYTDIDTYHQNPEKRTMESSHGHDNSLINGVGRLGFMRGGAKATWKDEDLCDTFLEQAKCFIAANKDAPFFLFYPTHQPHVPRVASKKFAGATKLGPRGDVIVEFDYIVGEVVATLEENNLLDNTIIIVSSDNGPVLDDGYHDQSPELNGNHRPTGPLRGGKYSKLDGGARIPFVVYAKNATASGESNALISQVDILASIATLLEIPLGANEAPDSQNMLDALLGKSGNGRRELMYESHSKHKVIRTKKWAYLEPSPGKAVQEKKNIELGHLPNDQLYNMIYDPGQRHNVATDYPDVVAQLKSDLAAILASSQTRN